MLSKPDDQVERAELVSAEENHHRREAEKGGELRPVVVVEEAQAVKGLRRR